MSFDITALPHDYNTGVAPLSLRRRLTERLEDIVAANGTAVVSARVTSEQKRRLEKIASSENVTIGTLAARILVAFLDLHPGVVRG